MPTYLGTTQALTSIPSLLISDLARVQDPVVRRALYQIQNFANSIGEVQNSGGTHSAVSAWVRVSYNGAPAYIPAYA